MPDRTFVVVGASLTGGTAAAALREEGFDGRLVVIGDERLRPYERPPLSKGYLRGEEEVERLFIRPDAWWLGHDVEMRLGERVELLDPRERAVSLGSGGRIPFDRAVVATGVRNRRLDVPGAELSGVFHLRTVADADAIRAAAAGAGKAVVVGMGFIGAEVAASVRRLGLDVTVVEIFETALFKILGGTIGRVLEGIHRDQGVEMLFEDTVERFEGRDRVERVVTRRGRAIECDLVVVGVGTEPNVEVMAGEALDPHGGIRVGPSLETSFEGVFAAGDVASHEHPVFGPVRVEHYDNAIKMGEHAARAMLDAAGPFDDPHWFWSDQYEHQIQMGGVFVTDDVVVRGSLEDRSFCAFFLRDGALRASVSLDWPRDVRRSLPLIRAQARPDRDALTDPAFDLRTLDPSRR